MPRDNGGDTVEVGTWVELQDNGDNAVEVEPQDNEGDEAVNGCCPWVDG